MRLRHFPQGSNNMSKVIDSLKEYGSDILNPLGVVRVIIVAHSVKENKAGADFLVLKACKGTGKVQKKALINNALMNAHYSADNF